MSKYVFLLFSLTFTHVAGAQNVGIGTDIPAAKLDVMGNIKITDGTQGAGKLLISGADGTASWTTPPAAACFFFNTDQSVANGGYIGLGSSSSNFVNNTFVVPFACQLTSITLSVRQVVPQPAYVVVTIYRATGFPIAPVSTTLSVAVANQTAYFATATGSVFLNAGDLISARITSTAGALSSGAAVSVTYR